MSITSTTIDSERAEVREMVRSWAVASGSIAAVRAAEENGADAWRGPYGGLVELGTFGVAVPEDLGGAGGSIADLCVMVDEAAAALVPGPVATTALVALWRWPLVWVLAALGPLALTLAARRLRR